MTQQQEPVYCRPAAYRMFSQQLPTVESGTGLFRAAFAIALHERPEAELAEVETIVENLVASVMNRVQSRSVTALMAHLHDMLFDVFGLRGNVEDFYNPANSYLPDVLKFRLGLPITLVLIYQRVAQPLGLKVYGVNAPGHFLAEVEAGDSSGRSLYIDPFFGGGVLSDAEVLERVQQATGLNFAMTPELLKRASHRQWLSRMLNNLQAAFAALGQEREVCAMQELQGLL